MVQIRLVRYVRECERIPRGYATAYFLPWSGFAACYPIGLHIVMGLAYSLYTRVMHWRCPAGWETLWRVRYELGREQGRREGYTAASKSHPTETPPRLHRLSTAASNRPPKSVESNG